MPKWIPDPWETIGDELDLRPIATRQCSQSSRRGATWVGAGIDSRHLHSRILFTGMERIMSINAAQRQDALAKLLTPEHDHEMVEIMQAAIEKRRKRGAIPPNARYAVCNCWSDFIGLNLDFVATLGDAQGLNGIYCRGVRGWTYIVL